jgi:TRAP-type C4-dicarboxylate transport system permease small subunit
VRKRMSFSGLLISAIGMILIFKTFIYVIEHFVFDVTGTPGLEVDESYLNIALVVLGLLLVIRLLYLVWAWKRRNNENNLIQQEDERINTYAWQHAVNRLAKK